MVLTTEKKTRRDEDIARGNGPVKGTHLRVNWDSERIEIVVTRQTRLSTTFWYNAARRTMHRSLGPATAMTVHKRIFVCKPRTVCTARNSETEIGDDARHFFYGLLIEDSA